MIYGPINDNSIWRTRHNNKLYTLCDQLYIVKVIKIGRLRWLGQFLECQKGILAESLLYLNQNAPEM